MPDWQVLKIERQIGVDVSGYAVDLVENDIRHVIGAHGDPKKEAARKSPREAIRPAETWPRFFLS